MSEAYMDVAGGIPVDGNPYGMEGPLIEASRYINKTYGPKQVGGDHYVKHQGMQPFDIIDEYGLNFYEGNALKYLLRQKGNRREDLEKAKHYIEILIEKESSGTETPTS